MKVAGTTGSAEDAARERADGFRRGNGLGVQPIGDLVTLIEQVTGVDVVVMEAGQDEHGLTMRDPERGAVFIAVARTPRPMRQRSSLAHELGHMLFDDYHPGRAGTGPKWQESRADAFARHLLLPAEGLDAFLDGRAGATLAALSDVVQRFRVSPAIAAIAMAQRGHIDEPTKKQWLSTLTTPKLATRFGWRDLYSALVVVSDRERAPQKLLARAIVGHGAGVISDRTLANVRGRSVDEVLTELAEAGVAAGNDVDEAPASAAALRSTLPRPEMTLKELDALLGHEEDGTGVS